MDQQIETRADQSSHNQKNIWIIISIIMISLISVGITWWLQENKINQLQDELDSIKQTLPQENSSAQSNEVLDNINIDKNSDDNSLPSDFICFSKVVEENIFTDIEYSADYWKTYISNELGITFLYPKTFRDINPVLKRATITLTDNSIEEERYIVERVTNNPGFHEGFNYGNILRVDFAQTDDFEKYRKDSEDEFLSSKDNIIINNKQWNYYQYDSGYAQKARINIAAYIDEIDKIIFFSYSTDNPGNLVAMKVILLKMIESMEFIN
jgi:hypothetical protein